MLYPKIGIRPIIGGRRGRGRRRCKPGCYGECRCDAFRHPMLVLRDGDI